MKDALRVRQVLAQSKCTEGSFTQMVANMGKPVKTSTGRKKMGTASQKVKESSSGAGKKVVPVNRFQIDSSESEGDRTLLGGDGTPVKGNLRKSNKSFRYNFHIVKTVFQTKRKESF